MSLAETLLWLCKIKSPIGEERELCDRVTERLASVQLAAPIRRYGESNRRTVDARQRRSARRARRAFGRRTHPSTRASRASKATSCTARAPLT